MTRNFAHLVHRLDMQAREAKSRHDALVDMLRRQMRQAADDYVRDGEHMAEILMETRYRVEVMRFIEQQKARR